MTPLRPFVALVACGLALGTVAAACTDDDGDDARDIEVRDDDTTGDRTDDTGDRTDDTGDRDDEPDDEDEELAEDIVLRIDDLPGGWEEDPDENGEDDEDEGSDELGDEAAECADPETLDDLAEAEHGAEGESPNFQSEDQTRFASSTAFVADAEVGEAVYELVTGDCYLQLLPQALAAGPEDDEATVVNLQSQPLTLPQVAEEVFGVRIAMELVPEGQELGFPFSFDFLVLHEDRALAFVILSGLFVPFPDEDRDEILEAVGERMAPAAA